MGNKRPRIFPPAFLISLIILLGIVLRLLHFDLMEFKADEVGVIVLTKYWIGEGIPRFGQLSTSGIPFPPGLIYLLYPLVFFTSSPLLIGLGLCVLSIAAIWLIYLLGVTLGSPAAGLWAAAFMAAHPWLILYSRKIWEPSPLPFFSILILIVVASCTLHSRHRSIFWAGPLLVMTWQFHYSAYAVAFFFCIWFSAAAFKKRINWSACLAGFLVGIVLLLPYFSYLARNDFVDLKNSYRFAGRGKSAPARSFIYIVAMYLKTAWAGGFGYPLARDPLPISRTPLGAAKPWLQILAALGTALIIFLSALSVFLRLFRRGMKSSLPSFIFWLLLFIALPGAVYLIKGIIPPPHYFLVSIPAVLMLAGIGASSSISLSLKNIKGKKCFFLPGSLAGAAVVVSGTVIWLSLIQYIAGTGGTAGDYGLAFRFQKEAAQIISERKINPRQVDAALTRDEGVGIFYLLVYRFKTSPPYSVTSARLIDSLLFPEDECRENEETISIGPSGPMKICVSSDNNGKSTEPDFGDVDE